MFFKLGLQIVRERLRARRLGIANGLVRDRLLLLALQSLLQRRGFGQRPQVSSTQPFGLTRAVSLDDAPWSAAILPPPPSAPTRGSLLTRQMCCALSCCSNIFFKGRRHYKPANIILCRRNSLAC